MSFITTILTKLSPAGIMASVYKWLAIAGVAMALAIGGFFYGKHYGDEQSKVAIANFVAKQTKQDDDLNEIQIHTVTKLVTQYVTKVVHIKDTGATNGEIIDKFISDHEFLSTGWVYAHNSSAAGTEIDPTAAANGTPSTVEANSALAVVNDNYTSCNATQEQLKSLQQWITDYNSSVDQVNADAMKGAK